ncbi:MAG: response regulator [Acidobacteria bacterium]|nr:response regulator [Acidobacteriota bacterium]
MSLSVILAEDDPDIQLVARLALKRVGFTVRVASNGVEAVTMARESPPDALLLDWMMPEMDGPQVCSILKSDPATAHIPIVFLTAKTQEAEIARGLSLGASGYVTKPFDALTLGDQVRAIIDARQP